MAFFSPFSVFIFLQYFSFLFPFSFFPLSVIYSAFFLLYFSSLFKYPLLSSLIHPFHVFFLFLLFAFVFFYPYSTSGPSFSSYLFLYLFQFFLLPSVSYSLHAFFFSFISPLSIFLPLILFQVPRSLLLHFSSLFQLFLFRLFLVIHSGSSFSSSSYLLVFFPTPFHGLFQLTRSPLPYFSSSSKTLLLPCHLINP